MQPDTISSRLLEAVPTGSPSEIDSGAVQRRSCIGEMLFLGQISSDTPGVAQNGQLQVTQKMALEAFVRHSRTLPSRLPTQFSEHRRQPFFAAGLRSVSWGNAELGSAGMKTRYVLVAVLFAGVAVYFGSPYWAVYRLKQAVEFGPPSELTRRIDFDAVREATKTELARATDERLKGNSRSSRAVTAGLGHMLAVAMISSKVDEFVTPDSLATLIERSTRDHDNVNSARQ